MFYLLANYYFQFTLTISDNINFLINKNLIVDFTYNKIN